MVRRLLILNGISIFAVVLYHSLAWGFISMFWWTHRYLPVSSPNFEQVGSLAYYGLRAVEQLVIFAIPAFLFVSGYFIANAAGRNQSSVSWIVILARIKTLAIPFLLWSVLILMSDILLFGASYTVTGFLFTILTGQTEPPYYYVPLLIQLLLLSVFLVPLAKDRWKFLLFVTALIQLPMYSIEYIYIFNPAYDFPDVLLLHGLFPRYIFWYSFGIVVGYHLSELKEWLRRIRWVLPVTLVATFILGIVEWEYLLRSSGEEWLAPRETIVDYFYAAAFLLNFIAFDNFIPIFNKQLSALGGKSYGIYLIHSPVLAYTAKIIYNVLPWLLAYQILMQPVMVIMGFGIPLLLMAFVDKSPVRKYYRYLFG